MDVSLKVKRSMFSQRTAISLNIGSIAATIGTRSTVVLHYVHTFPLLLSQDEEDEWLDVEVIMR